jgi:uncharacterized protein (DUF983 family)
VSKNGATIVPHGAFWAILHLRCPKCHEGKIFRGRFAMNERCPVCNLLFEREQGYFLGAMYFSYALSIPILGAILLVEYLLFPQIRTEYLVLLAVIPYLPLMAPVFRYSRALWIYFDRWASPYH